MLETQGNDNLLNDFSDILAILEIPHTPYKRDYKKDIDQFLEKVLDDLNY